MKCLDPDASPEYALQCIEWCAENGEISALVEHLKHHKDRLNDKLIPMLVDIFSKHRIETIKVILSPLDKEVRKISCILLCFAVEMGDIDILKELLEKGADMHGYFHGKPLLHYAACIGNPFVVKELVKAGADINVIDRYGDGIIHSILTSPLANKGPIVKEVISLGADPLVKSSSAKLPIHLAAKHAPDVLTELLRKECDVNITDDVNEDTPLHIACGAACPETILILLQHGSRLNIENKQGQTPLAKLLRYTNSDLDFHTKTRLNLAKVLISIGFSMKCQSCQRPFNLSYKGRDKFYDRYVSLKMSLNTPAPLLSLVRTSVRKTLIANSGIQKEINKLDIPESLKSYLMFRDLRF